MPRTVFNLGVLYHITDPYKLMQLEIVRQPLGDGRDCPHELYDRMDRRCLVGFKEPVALPDLVQPK